MFPNDPACVWAMMNPEITKNKSTPAKPNQRNGRRNSRETPKSLSQPPACTPSTNKQATPRRPCKLSSFVRIVPSRSESFRRRDTAPSALGTR